jgi:hypothetical protein
MSDSIIVRICATAILMAVAIQAASGQEEEPPKPKQKQIGELPDHLAKKVVGLEPKELEKLVETTQNFGVMALIFGGILIGVLGLLAYNRLLTETSVVRLFSLIFLATLAVFLIVGGYSQVQIGSAMTLLGTLAGYIFGRNEKPPNAQQPTAQQGP